jgi:hypothetical protein
MIGVDGVAEAERIGQEGRADQHRIVMEGNERPNPGQHIGGDQRGVNDAELAAEPGVLIVE